MSWYMFMDIYSRENGNWKCEIANKEYYPLKSLCGNRGLLVDEITTVKPADKEALDALQHEHDYRNHIYIGSVSPTNWANLDVPTVLETWAEGHASGYVVDEKYLEKVEKSCEDPQVLLTLSEEERSTYINVYYVKQEERGYGHGCYYNAGSFTEYIRKEKEELKVLTKKKKTWDKIRNSMDYMKLSSEEKSNVEEDFLYLDDAIQEVEAQLKAAENVVTILDFFSDYDKEVVAFIFSD